MDIDTNKQLVTTFFDHIDAREFDAGFAMMTDDATWWIPSDAPGGTTMTKAQMRQAVDTFSKVFKTLPKMERVHMTAEGDRVCLEQYSRGGETFGGAAYANDYHLVIVLRDDRISEIREYMNPLLGAAVIAEIQAAH